MTETANAFWGLGFILLLIVFFAVMLRNRGTDMARKRLERNEGPSQEAVEETGSEPEDEASWVDVAAFPMEHRNIQPFGAQLVTRKTYHDHMPEYLRLLEEAGIPFRTHIDEASTFQAEAIRVPKEHWERAKEILEKLHPRDELY
jgi:hypothetical protein